MGAEYVRVERSRDVTTIILERPNVRNAVDRPTGDALVKAFLAFDTDEKAKVAVLWGAGGNFCAGADLRGLSEGRGNRLSVPGHHFDAHAVDAPMGPTRMRLSKPVVAAVAGYAVGGGHILHLVCDLTIAADNARFGQTGPRVGSFDGGFGAGLLARQIGAKRAKEIWFLLRLYDADEAFRMGLVNTVVPVADLEREAVAWCREMGHLSPLSLRLLKSSFNAAEDGITGLQQLSHDATLLFYMSEEGQEGRNAYQEHRPPDFSKFPRRP